MSPRTGRPKNENSMNERITVRLDKETSEILKKYCEKNNIERSEAIRLGIRKLG
ncbi:ribbon-helix-helix protein, CopG family [uncultured Anaerofustis sp.]|uniref:ribbon-helix-helix protein, CopG family n=1 Tax=uncultured Anaerofustis sp. TaxID=904996 RepID=UPI0025F51E33|nr:ribbon-helix-helix protein, CopG family [uncultured Anaerofustis sp.]